MATLYLVSTPIGNLDDVSARAANTLRSVGRVLAEELLAKEKARLRAEERNRAATSIQKQARGRNRRRAMRDAAAGKKSKKDKKGKKKKKGKK